jgi:hypothetical protein
MQCAHELVEEAGEGARAGVGRLLENPLLRFRQHVGSVAAHGREMVAPPREGGVLQQGIDGFGVERDPFELEEQQRRPQLRRPLLHVLEQRTVTFAAGIGGEQETRVCGGLRDRVEERLVLVDRAGELPGAELRYASAVAALEGAGIGERAVEVRVDLRIVGTGVEVGQVPTDSRGERGFVRGRGRPGPAHRR